MKNGLTSTLLLGATLLTLGSVNPALAADYSGALTFDSHTASTTIDVFGTPVPITVGIDLDRYDLGNALGGSTMDVSFTTHNAFDPNSTMLAVVFTTDPNDTLFNDPTSIVGIIDPTANDATPFFNQHVTGWQYYAYGDVLVSNGTTDISGMFHPMNFDLGTNYYAFVAGGSIIPSGATIPTDASVGYTLSVATVPEPETWGMMAAGLGVFGLLFGRRRRNSPERLPRHAGGILA
jgi:PEP-CTERM motif